MIELLTDNHKETLVSLFSETEEKIEIISPFLTDSMAKLLCEASDKGVNCRFVTRFYLQDFIDGSNTLDGIEKMYNAGVEIYALIGLHTKLYLFDGNDAIVGSANFTEAGMNKNIELSLYLSDEHAVEQLQQYFEDLITKIGLSDEARITTDDIQEFKLLHLEHMKTKSKLTGDVKVKFQRKGAALDIHARELKRDDNKFFEEIQNWLHERSRDTVYGLLDGNKDEISHKELRNIILKFSASAKARYDGSKKMSMDEFIDDGKRFYMSNFSLSRRESAKKIEEGDETFFCVHSYDKNGNPCPMIVGKGHLREYKHNNDARLKKWINNYDWLKEYPLYCVIDDAKIINAPVCEGIPLREVVDALGYKTYTNTANRPEEYPKERVYKSHGQQAIKYLTIEAKKYIDTRLEKLWDKYGATEYESEV